MQEIEFVSGAEVFAQAEVVRQFKFRDIIHASVRTGSGIDYCRLASYGSDASNEFISISGIRRSKRPDNATVSNVIESSQVAPPYFNVIWLGQHRICYIKWIIIVYNVLKELRASCKVVLILERDLQLKFQEVTESDGVVQLLVSQCLVEVQLVGKLGDLLISTIVYRHIASTALIQYPILTREPSRTIFQRPRLRKSFFQIARFRPSSTVVQSHTARTHRQQFSFR